MLDLREIYRIVFEMCVSCLLFLDFGKYFVFGLVWVELYLFIYLGMFFWVGFYYFLYFGL